MGIFYWNEKKKTKKNREMILKFVHENSIVKSNYIQQIPGLYLLTIMGILWYKVLYLEIQW